MHCRTTNSTQRVSVRVSSFETVLSLNVSKLLVVPLYLDVVVVCCFVLQGLIEREKKKQE